MMTDSQAHEAAERAVAQWGGAQAPPRLVAKRENAVFEVILKDGQHVALRLHRPGYQAEGAIKSELAYMFLLAMSGFRCPSPVATQAGELVAQADGHFVSAVRWLYGTPIGAAQKPLEGNPDQQQALLHALGALLAKLHNTTDKLDLPKNYQRPAWDEEGLLGEVPLWGRFWQNPALTLQERDMLLDVRTKAVEALAEYRRKGADFGLIHADALRENVLMDEAGLALIDFDDCGFGFRMYDLGVALSQNDDEPEAERLEAALLAGYGEHRTLPDHAERLLPMFRLLRALASCGWIIGRASRNDPRLGYYAARAVKQAKAFLENG